MNNYVITTDNNADLPEEFYKEHQIGCTYFSYTLDGKEYTKENFLLYGRSIRHAYSVRK